MTKTEIESATAVLAGKALWQCLRAADMATFQFGGRKSVAAFRGGTKEVGEYALHVQCAWRITRQDRVIVGSRDLYYPADYEEGAEVPSGFAWDKDSNRRDRLLTSLFENGSREFLVQKVRVGVAGSLSILLSEDLAVDIFPDDSLSGERWRLFEPGRTEQHFVVTGKGIEA